MLYPENTNRFTLLALDPGLNNIGVAFFEVQVEPAAILSIQAETLKADKMVDTSGLDLDDSTERLRKRYLMGRALKALLERFQPQVVACESPFFDRRKPGSFAVLSEVLTTLFDTVMAYDARMPFRLIEPLTAKAVLGVAGQKGKEVVAEAVGRLPQLTEVLDPHLCYLDEHAIDACAVGYTYLVRQSGLFDHWDRKRTK